MLSVVAKAMALGDEQDEQDEQKGSRGVASAVYNFNDKAHVENTPYIKSAENVAMNASNEIPSRNSLPSIENNTKVYLLHEPQNCNKNKYLTAV